MQWTHPKTEEGLLATIRQIEECRHSGAMDELGNGLLAMSFLVKWVGSDNLEPPFERSRTLALEALEVFTSIGHRKGECRALRQSVPNSSPEQQQEFFARATLIAEELGDDAEVARTLAARARATLRSNRAEAEQLLRSALEIFQELGDRIGEASTHFSLVSCVSASEEKYTNGVSAFEAYRQCGVPDDAVKALVLAMHYGSMCEPRPELESLLEQGVELATSIDDHSSMASFYVHLALLESERGDSDKAQRYLDLQAESRSAREQANEIDERNSLMKTLKKMIDALEIEGDQAGAAEFRQQLELLISPPGSA